MFYGHKRNLFIYGGFLVAEGYQPKPVSWSDEALNHLDEMGISICPEKYEPSIKVSLNGNHNSFTLKTLFIRQFSNSIQRH